MNDPYQCDDESFERVRRFLGGNTDVPEPVHLPCLRLVRAARSGRAGSADLAVLVRQVLRWEEARLREVGGSREQSLVPQLSVPSILPWPTRELWRRAGIHAEPDQNQRGGPRFRLTASEWIPEWLKGAAAHPPAAALALPIYRRSHRPVSGDPALLAAGRASYLCSGQRGAMHAIFTAPPAATLLVNLPTGAGKSLCAQLPAVISGDGLTVVVVPTTALCIDQEKAIREKVPALGTEHTAYYSTTDGLRNQGIRQRIYAGTQRIVFASPEAVCGSLAPALYRAAGVGRLRWLVIDEAHMVEQWGDEFRPAFQELAGLRRDLMRADSGGDKFRTLLLSATVTPATFETLRNIFGQPGPFDMAAAVQLRPEPSYWRSFCPGDGEGAAETQRERVLEALLHLPRPAILYTTMVPLANAWAGMLRDLGFDRLDVVTGKTPASDREKVLTRWRTAATDLVVGTSAFGLGVDQPDVRAVIHACMPENLDRFYQEVGRGGRDGRASISLVIDTAQDTKDGAGINMSRLITIDKGLPRWRAMFEKKDELPDGRYAVSLERAAAYGMRGDYSEAWNARLLTLMARAGLITLDYEPPKLSAWQTSDQATGTARELERQDEWQAHRKRRVIRIVEQRHLDDDVWQQTVETSRETSADQSRRTFKLLQQALSGKRCIAETLAEMYTIDGRAHVAVSCGGCEACRREDVEPYADEMPPVRPTWTDADGSAGLRAALAKRIGSVGVGALAIFYDRDAWQRWKQHLRPVVEWLIAQGVRNIALSRGVREQWLTVLLENRANMTVMLHDLEELAPLWLPLAPTVVLHPPGLDLPTGCYFPDFSGDQRAVRVLLLPEDARDPDGPHRALRSVIACPSLLLNELVMEVGL